VAHRKVFAFVAVVGAGVWEIVAAVPVAAVYPSRDLHLHHHQLQEEEDLPKGKVKQPF
jgi:hypothetical protein